MAELSTNLVPMTDLEAVNGMLALIGEAPVTTILDTGLADVNLATQMLRNNSRQIQTRGWSFNTDTEYPITRDSNNYLLLPINALVASPTKGSGVRAVQRGNKLWDLENRTFVWGNDISMDFVWFLAFNELPDHARQYIFAAACMDFAKAQMASAAVLNAAEQEFAMARTLFKQAERRISRPNVFRDSATTALDLYRGADFTYIPGRY
jgi:hypothetical protein